MRVCPSGAAGKNINYLGGSDDYDQSVKAPCRAYAGSIEEEDPTHAEDSGKGIDRIYHTKTLS